MKKIVLILLGIIAINLCAFAIESDFKNSLLKVDYVKTGNDSYNIRLFTQKPYSEPIKVIKKTNTNYYILLPETFHSVGSIAPTGDIKSTEVKLFPYAGQDLNNGYTKINIFTSKPLNIKAQLNSSTGSVAPTIDPKKLSQLDSAFNTKQAQINEAQRQAQYAAQQKQIQEQKRIAAQKAQQEAQRQAQLKAQQEAQARAEAQRQAQYAAQQKQIQEQKRIAAQKAQQEAQKRKEIQNIPKAQNTNNLQVLDSAANKYQEDNSKEKKSGSEFNEQTPNETQNEINQENIVTQDIINNPEVNKTIAQIPELPSDIQNKADIKEIIKDKLKPAILHLRPYYYIIKDNLTLVIAIIIAFAGILMLFAINKNKKKGTAENMEAQQTTDNEKQNVETLMNDVNNALSEESKAGIDEIKAFKDEFKALAQDAPEEIYIEPQVLSSVEIAPNRGFMVIDRQGTKALFGYIFDDVFLLYQFKEFISDYEIKFRISEKQDDKTFFIVKVDKFKLLVRVTNKSMKLELEM